MTTDTTTPSKRLVRSVRPRDGVPVKQGLTYFLGVSAHTAGSRGLSMHIVTIPPGARSTPHSHSAYETADQAFQLRHLHTDVARVSPNRSGHVLGRAAGQCISRHAPKIVL